jgi:hypothetical protein
MRLCVTAAVRVLRALRGLATWAAGRSISPNSLSGISLLLALCAAAWFSGGAGQDSGRGALAMIGWLAVLAVARWLAVFTAGQPAASSAAAVTQEAALRYAWPWSVSAAAGECAIYGGMAAGNEAAGIVGIWPLAVGTVIAVATAELLGVCLAAAPAAQPVERSGPAAVMLCWTGRLLRLPAGARGSIALLAFAIAGVDGAFFAVLAVSVLAIAVTVAMLGKIAPAAGRTASPSSAATSSSDSSRGRSIRAREPKTGRLGPRSVPGRTPWPAPVSGITIIGGPASQEDSDVVQVAAAAGGGERASENAGSWGAVHAAGVDRSAGSKGTARVRGTAGSGDVGHARGTAEAGPTAYASAVRGIGGTASQPGARYPVHVGEPAASGGGAWPEPDGAERAERSDGRRYGAKDGGARSGQVNTRAAAREAVLPLRDDGAAARWAGRLVQGNLIPLPPALAGLVATSLLAVLGLRNLPGFIVLTPPVVMMLAAPGSSHPHDRRFDWLVPVLLALAQYAYLAPLGFALAVPGPVIFSACALILIWYTGVMSGSATGPGRGTTIGWETRMFTVGFAATFGLATFGYVGLATYLGVLICRKVMTGYLVPREEDRQ